MGTSGAWHPADRGDERTLMHRYASCQLTHCHAWQRPHGSAASRRRNYPRQPSRSGYGHPGASYGQPGRQRQPSAASDVGSVGSASRAERQPSARQRQPGSTYQVCYSAGAPAGERKTGRHPVGVGPCHAALSVRVDSHPDGLQRGQPSATPDGLTIERHRAVGPAMVNAKNDLDPLDVAPCLA
jgi:hypothetical protein